MTEPKILDILKIDCKYPEVLRTVRLLVHETEIESGSFYSISREEKEMIVRGALNKLGEFIPLILDIPRRLDMLEGAKKRPAEREEVRKVMLAMILQDIRGKIPELDAEAVRADIGRVDAKALERPCSEVIDVLCGYLKDRSPAVREEALHSIHKLRAYVQNKTIALTHLNWSCACDPNPDNRKLARQIIDSFLFDPENGMKFENILYLKNAVRYADTQEEASNIENIIMEAKHRVGPYDWHMRHVKDGIYDIPVLASALKKAADENEQAVIIRILANAAEEMPAENDRCLFPLFYALKEMKDKMPAIEALERYNVKRNDELVMEAFIATIQNENCSDSPLALRAMRALATCIDMRAWGLCELIANHWETPQPMREEALRSRWIVWEKLDRAGRFEPQEAWPKEIKIDQRRLDMVAKNSILGRAQTVLVRSNGAK